MEIKACPRCGSTKIFQGTMGDGVLTGYTSRQVCQNCGFQGMPLIFSNEEEYKRFLKGLQTEKGPQPSKEHIKENDQSKHSSTPKGLYFLILVLLIETVIALYLFSIYPPFIQAANVPGVAYLTMFVLTGIIIPIGILTNAKWTFTVAGILFIFTIPINLPLLYYITRPHIKSFLLKKQPKKQRN